MFWGEMENKKTIWTTSNFSLSIIHLFLQMLHSPANKRSNIFPGDGCHRHWHGRWSGQPVGIVISGGEVADIVDIAEQEGHRTELAQAASSCAWRRRERRQSEVFAF